MSSIRRCHVSATLVFFLAGASVGGAQVVGAASDTVCASARLSLRSTSVDRMYAEALAGLLSCSQTGPSIIVEEWARSDLPPNRLAALSRASGTLRDQRIYDAVTARVLDSSAEDRVRLEGMGVLVRYFDQCLAVLLREPGDPIRGGRSAILLGEYDHDPSTEGAIPLNRSVRADVLAVFRRVAALEPQGIVGEAATAVISQLGRKRSPLRC